MSSVVFTVPINMWENRQPNAIMDRIMEEIRVEIDSEIIQEILANQEAKEELANKYFVVGLVPKGREKY